MLIFTNSPAAHGAVVRPGRLEAAAAPTELAVLIAAFKVHIYMREHHWVHDYIRNSYNMMFDAAIASANKYIIHPTYLQTKATSTQIHKHTCIDIYTCIHYIHTYNYIHLPCVAARTSTVLHLLKIVRQRRGLTRHGARVRRHG